MYRLVRIHAVLVSAISLAGGCGDSSARNGGDGGLDANAHDLAHTTLRHDVAVSIATNVILPTLVALETRAVALESATETHAADPTDVPARDAARAAWRDAMAVTQRAELMQIGPAGAMSDTLGGESLRDEIYAWPEVARCRIDQEVVEGAFADVDAFAAELVNVRGLGAIEHLLFVEGTVTACPVAPPGWGTDLEARRAAYAATLAVLVRRDAERLRQAWEPGGGHFLREVETAGVGSGLYSSAQAALNAISDAMFYLDIVTKDMKLGTPAGVSAACTDTGAVICPDSVELSASDASFAAIRENLAAFRALFIGGEPGTTNLGFDDLLVSLGQSPLVDEILLDIDEAIDAIEAFVLPLEQAVVSDLTSVLVAYGELKDVTDSLKSHFVGVLDLEPPLNRPTDTD
jgi:predicted lipoprotein